MYAAPVPNALPGNPTGNGGAAVCGVIAALVVLVVVPFFATVPFVRSTAPISTLAFVLGAPALWLGSGRKGPIGAFGFAATIVVAVFIACAAALFGLLLVLLG